MSVRKLEKMAYLQSPAGMTHYNRRFSYSVPDGTGVAVGFAFSTNIPSLMGRFASTKFIHILSSILWTNSK
ncbi:MAG: hypothetical protein LBD59_11725 [Prevotellaceae bacterium]|nr:hypothetical protein [Prevotellaceae bacterium]